MPFVPIPRLSVELCRDVPTAWFVFGDNALGRGLAGQACIRHEPNAIGIPTKWAPSMSNTAFFRDQDLIAVRSAITRPFDRLEELLRAGSVVCWPQADIGTGLAQLPQRAPTIYALILERRERLIALAAEL